MNDGLLGLSLLLGIGALAVLVSYALRRAFGEAAPSPRRPVAPSPPGRRAFVALLREARSLNERLAHTEARREDERAAIRDAKAWAERTSAVVQDTVREAFRRVEPPRPKETDRAYLRRLDKMARDLRRRTRGPGEG